MNPHDSHFFAPPITEVPDYVWARRPDTPKDTGRWYGRSASQADAPEFLVYEGI